MRLRNVKGSQEKILENPYTIQTDGTNGEDYKGLWNKNIFKNDNPIHIEIGMGKGQFIMGLAAENPDINYIGIEKYSSVLVRALDKRESLETDNLMFLRMDAEDIAEYFAPGEVSRIYLNFSDPWPKDRHAKRRLTSHEFLARYEKILKKDGTLEFKTDNKDLFDYSLEEMKNAEGWELTAFTYDLHHDVVLSKGNVMTEYEEKFSSIGNPICKMEARFL